MRKLGSVVRDAATVENFYKQQLSACRQAIDMWTLVAIRKRVVKDIRRLVSKMIWETRSEALFKSIEKKAPPPARQQQKEKPQPKKKNKK